MESVKKFVLPIVLVVLSLIMMMGSTETRIRRASFFSKTIFFPISSSLESIKTNSALKKEVQQLSKQLAETRLENLKLKNTLIASQSQESITFDTGDVELILAEVIGYSGPFQQRNLIVNKGSLDGIKPEFPVISTNCIVGKVITVASDHSIVLPFTNPRFQLPVMDKDTGVQGILQADLNGKIYMNMIKIGSQISVGDTIVTSNLSDLYPKSYPVGMVSRIHESQDYLFISAEIKPFAQVENLEHIFIIKKNGTL
jgi:rod shape-determining protein MreC